MKNKKTLKSMLLIAILTMSTILFVACGGGDGDTNQAATSQSDGAESDSGTTIEYWHTMSEEKAIAMDLVVDEFNNTIGKERGIVVNSVYQGNDTNEKLKTLSLADDTENFPDVSQVAGPATPSVMNYAQTVTPQEMYDKGENIIVEFDELVPNAVRTFTYDGELKVMPFNVSSILLYYNVDAFVEAGLDPDTPPETIEELAEYAEALTVKDGDDVVRHGLNVQVKRYQLSNFVGSQGEFNFIGNNEGGRAGMMTEVTAGAEIEKFLNEWKKVVDSGGYQAVENNINEEFSLGLHGMAIMSSARIETITNLVDGKFEFRTANLPKVDANDTGGTATGGSGVAFFDKGDEDKLTAAWIFTQYLASADAQKVFDINTGYLPVNKSTIEDPEFEEYLEENLNFKVAVMQMSNSHPNVQEPFDIINWEVNDIVDAQMLEFAEGQDVQTTKDNIVNQINEKLKAHAEANK